MQCLDTLYEKLAEVLPVDDTSLNPETSLHSIDGLTREHDNDKAEQELKREFLTPSDRLPWSLLNEFYNVPKLDGVQKEKVNFSLINMPELLNRTSIRFKRAGIDGSIVSFKEEFTNDDSSSLSVSRKYTGNSRLSVKGNTSSLPFLPGGFQKPDDNTNEGESGSTRNLHRDQYGLFDVPQGFSRGLQLDEGSVDMEIIGREKNGLTRNIDEIEILPEAFGEEVQSETENDYSGDDEVLSGVEADVANSNKANKISSNEDFENEISQFIPKNSVIRPSTASSSLIQQYKRKTTWAHVVDLDHRIENFDELIPNPARTWPFELDIFQREAVYHLEQGDSVFVAAHTSAGKTVVAEYAIAMAHKNMTKAIYTSPIKALSNQKFRDFKHTFKELDVGVITGDVQINPEANCLIMTTEILRSMLYRGSDVIRDVEFVIFDEVHYVNDVDRGVVWEEVIIMLPDHVKIILLSATVPNTLEFASWVGRTKQKDIYVISTPKRPVPLEIYIFAKDTPYKVIDSNRHFLESGYNLHSDKFNKKSTDDTKIVANAGRGSGRGGSGRGGGRGGVSAGGRGSSRGGVRGGRGGRGGSLSNNGPRFIKRDAPTSKSWSTLVDYMRKNDLLPAVIFVFSKKRCEEYAESLSGFNFSNSRESSEIHMFIDKAVARLKKEDRELPQILRMREMLKRGIAVHHGGLLPIIKEVVEILFSKSLIKVLFATETFAMGLNLPTRTVVFSSLRKHDGTGFRDLLPGEFTQMSGRAGRRGLDKIGTVMIMAYQQPLDKTSLKQVALGVPTKLSSQFRLTYTMILNLLRIEALKVEDMIKRSFGENSSQSMLPEQQLEILRLEKELESIPKLDIGTEDLVKLERIYTLSREIRELQSGIYLSLENFPKLRKFLKFGRIIVFKDRHQKSMVGVILDDYVYKHSVTCLIACEVSGKQKENDRTDSSLFFNPVFGERFINAWFPRWLVSGREKIHSQAVKLSSIEFVSNEFVHVPKEIFKKDTRAIERFRKEFSTQLDRRARWSETDYQNLMFESNIELVLQRVKVMKDLSELLNDIEVVDLITKGDNYLKVSHRMEISEHIESLKKSLSDENLELLPEYNKRLEVLKTLDYVNPEQLTINLKGRVACEINSGWELVMTELVFDNFLGGFSSEEIVALLSCFVFEGKRGSNKDEAPTKLSTPRLEKGKEKICSIVEKIMTISTELKIQLTAEEDSFLENDRFALVNTVYEWARGRSFKDIMEYANDADESEGTIVRVITFLDEICMQVRNASIITGDSALHSKMTDAQEKIKRDIVFCASLYL